MALVSDDLVIDQGADFAAIWLYKTIAVDADGVEGPPLAVDLTGWHARSQVRQRADGPALCTWDSDPTAERDGPIELDAEGRITLSLPGPTSSTLGTARAWIRAKACSWDLELHSPTGQQLRFAEGSATLKQEITR